MSSFSYIVSSTSALAGAITGSVIAIVLIVIACSVILTVVLRRYVVCVYVIQKCISISLVPREAWE